MKTYSHTQTGTAIVGAMLIMAGVFSILGLCVMKTFFITVLFLLVVGWLFHSLKIDIGDGRLRWAFGSGLIRNSAPLTEIVSAVPVKSGLSWGIHWSPRLGWLYNVSGWDAVLVTLRSGKKFALGTDEPQILAARLEEIIRQNPPATFPA
jgi:hypothetical protein